MYSPICNQFFCLWVYEPFFIPHWASFSPDFVSTIMILVRVIFPVSGSFYNKYDPKKPGVNATIDVPLKPIKEIIFDNCTRMIIFRHFPAPFGPCIMFGDPWSYSLHSLSVIIILFVKRFCEMWLKLIRKSHVSFRHVNSLIACLNIKVP